MNSKVSDKLLDPNKVSKRVAGIDEQLDTSDKSWEIPNAEELMDESLSTPETIDFAQETKEINDNAVAKHKLFKQDEVTPAEGSDWEKERFGRILHYQPFLELLNTIIPARYNDFSKYSQVGLNVLVPTFRGRIWKYICAVQVGYMPEYEIMKVNDHGVTDGTKYRGYQTVLLRLITESYCPIHEGLKDIAGNVVTCDCPKEGVWYPKNGRVKILSKPCYAFTEEQVYSIPEFQLKLGTVSRRMREQLHRFRNRIN